MENKKLNSATGRPVVLATLTKNAIANLARLGAAWIVVLFLPPLLVRVLDKPTYATWVLILQIGAYVSLLDNGIQSAIGRFVARADQDPDKTAMRKTLSSTALILLTACLIATVATVICSWQLEHIFHGIPASIIFRAQWALVIVGTSLALGLPFSTFAGAFLGLQRNEINALAGGIGKLSGAAGAAWAAWHHQGLVIMALWIGAGNILQSLIFLLSSLRTGLHSLLHYAHVSRVFIREFVHFSYAMFATQLSALLITGLDMPIVVAFDFHNAAYYALAATAGSMLAAPQGAVVTPLVPVASEMSTVQSPEQLGAVVIRTTRYASATLCLFTLPLLFALFPFLRIWVGNDYATHALVFAAILVIAQFIRLTLMPYAAIGFAVGQQGRMLISPLGEGIVNLGCSVLGAIWLGALGVALGTLVGAIVGVLLHFVVSMPRTNSMMFSRRRLLFSGIFRSIACCLPAIALLAILVPRLGTVAGLALVAIGEVVTASILWRGNFEPGERYELKGVATKMCTRCLKLAKADFKESGADTRK